MFSKKTKQLISRIIIVLLILAMVVPMAISAVAM